MINQSTYLVGDNDEVKIQVVYQVSNVDLREQTFGLHQEYSNKTLDINIYTLWGCVGCNTDQCVLQ